jgi:hypothetical protein
MKNTKATYVYCVIASAKPLQGARVPAGLPGMGKVRVLPVDRGLHVAVADAPLSRYGEDAINRGLADLEWVSKAAIAHEAVVESFIGATAVLPMKLFTIFTTDDRAVDHVRAQRGRIAAVVRRVANHDEWGIRVALDRAQATRASAAATPRKAPATGVDYLTRKKARRDAAVELAERAQETVAALYDRFAERSKQSKRRTAGELPVESGPLLLDAAFLVPRTRSAAFRAMVEREARKLKSHGYDVTLTGPWPPYTFVQDS